jgi:hypothetical protein
MLLIKPLHKEYRQLITQLTVSGHLLFFTVLLTGSTPKWASRFVSVLSLFPFNLEDAAKYLNVKPVTREDRFVQFL